MKKSWILCLTTAVLFNSAFVFAQYTDDKNSAESSGHAGMEERKVNNDVTVLMPKGGKMYERNKSTYIQESADEYSSRNFADIYNRLKKLEEDNKELTDELTYLKSKLILQDKGSDKDAPKNPQE